MAHQLETWSDGSASFASARTPGWHQLGVTLPSDLTAEEALTHAKLGGWDVQPAPVFALVPNTTKRGDHVETYEPYDAQYALTRINPESHQRELFGGKYARPVGERYQNGGIIQNEELITFLQALIDEGGAFIETAGSIRGGTDVFITARLPEQMQVGGSDAVNSYICCTNNLNGTAAARAFTTNIRVVCANTLAAALTGVKNDFRIFHTNGSGGSIAEARQALALTWKYDEAFHAEADKMIAQSYTDAEFQRLVSGLWAPVKDDSGTRAKNNEAERSDKLRWLFHEADTNDGIHDTRWGAYQSVVEYLDHYSPVKGAVNGAADKVRATRTVTDQYGSVKREAWSALAVK